MTTNGEKAIDTSYNIVEIFRALYDSESIKFKSEQSFESIMKNNATRVAYLNDLLLRVQKNNLSQECKRILDDNIDYLNAFLNNELSKEITIPKEYYDDKEENLIIPTMGDIEYLFYLFEENMSTYREIYSNNAITLELPYNSFNQNMYRILDVKIHNLAHLFGLTESEPTPDPSKNLLKKYYLANFSIDSKEPVSTQLLKWILSDQGKAEIRRIHQITLDFVEKDKKKNPNSYDSVGNLKSKSLEAFKKRFKAETNLDYPILRFSRYMVKCINNLNFLNLNNTTQMILDYNAPPGKKDEKDIFIVNTSPVEMKKDVKSYRDLIDNVNGSILEYIFSSNEKNRIKQDLKEKGIDIEDKIIEDYINIMLAYEHIGAHNILPKELNEFDNKIREIISNGFKHNVHVIGFQTEYKGNPIPTDKTSVALTHCDTSISLTVPELVGEYYQRGRAFFIDKVIDARTGNILRISNPMEEIEFDELVELSNNKKNNKDELIELMRIFKKRFITYKATKNFKF